MSVYARRDERVLAGVRVVDCGTGVAGPLTGMFLADFGADVVKVEPPRGDPERRKPGFEVWNRGKRSVVLDPDREADRAALRGLLDLADVWILSSDSTAQAWGVDVEAVRRANPALVVVELPPYLDATPWAGGAESGPLLSAWGGEHWRHSSSDGAPVDSVYRHVLTVHGIWAAACTVAALVDREKTGAGQVVRVAGAQALALMTVGSLTVDVDAPDPDTAIGVAGRHPTYTRFETGDGTWLACGALGAKFESEVLRVLGLAEILAAEQIGGNPANLVLPHNIGWVGDRVRAAFRTRPRDEWIPLLEAAGIPCGPIGPADEWLDAPQVAAIGMRVELQSATGEPLVMAGVPIALEATPGRVAGPAPLLGSDTPGTIDWAPRLTVAAELPAPRPGPLAGVRVLDIGTFVAGPYAGALLAELGAHVTKVEPLTGDPFRRSGFTFNRGMRSMAVDLKHPEGREAFLQLVRQSDAVLDALRPGVATSLGIDYAHLREVKPDVITLSLSAYGEGGPLSRKPGVDMVIQGMCGLMTAQGGADEPIPNTIAIIDVTTACLSVLGTCLAVLHRERTGEGQRVWDALAATATFLQAAETVRVGGRSAAPSGGRDFKGRDAADRYYRTCDGWVRVALGTDVAWTPGLAAACGLDVDPADLARDPAAAIGLALGGLPTAEVVLRLGRAGVPAAPARRVTEVLRDESLIAAEIVHLQLGDDGRYFSTPGRLATFSRTQRRGPMQVAGVGEHTRALLTASGCSAEEVDALVAARAVATGGAAAQQLAPAYR